MVDSRVYPDLERAPGSDDNWVERAGELPDYVERIAKHLHYERGMTISQAIATAVNTIKRWTTGTNHDGSKLTPQTVARATQALAQWEALKAKARGRTSAFTASVVVEMPDLPSVTAFADPKFKAPMRMTVTADGRVSGHALLWGSCHRGYAGRCQEPPADAEGKNYDEFHTGQTPAVDEDGEVFYVPTGVLTVATDHAPDEVRGSANRAAYYSDTGYAAADVVAGADEHGLWVAGVVREGASAAQVAALTRSPLSGDWENVRYSDGATVGSLVALLAVNAPGYPVHASADSQDGQEEPPVEPDCGCGVGKAALLVAALGAASEVYEIERQV